MDERDVKPGTDQVDKNAERDSKRTKAVGKEEEESASAAAAGAEAAAAAAAATTAAGAPPTAAEQQKQQQQRQLDRTLEVLFIVLERQRHAARAARLVKRREQALAAAAASAPRDAEWACDGGLDDDGEDGQVTGGGWRREAWTYPGPVSVFECYDDDCAGGNGEGKKARPASPPPAPTPDLVFLQSCAALGRVCSSWRALALRAVDRAVMHSSVQRPCSALRDDFEGGVLHALWICATREQQGEEVELVGSALSSTEDMGQKRDPVLEGVLNELKVLKLDHASTLDHGLSLVPLKNPPPRRPLFRSLVHLQVGRWPSTWSPRHFRQRRTFFLLSRLYFPALRVLDVELHWESDCPLQIAWPSDEQEREDAAMLPPPLTHLHVTCRSPPPDNEWGVRGRETWPTRESLLVSALSLAALAPTLRSLAVPRTWCSAGACVDETAHWDQPRPALFTTDLLEFYALETGNARPPQRLAPMASLLEALSGLTKLTSLSLSAFHDWQQAFVQKLPESDEGDETTEQQRSALEGASADARLKEWLGPEETHKEEEQQQQSPGAAAAASAPAAASAAAAAPSPSGAALGRLASERHDRPKQPPHFCRSLDVLLIVLERQREAARAARVERRLELARLAASPSRPRAASEWARWGAAHDDRMAGGVTGGGWTREAEGVAEGEGGGGGGGANEPAASRDFALTRASAARVCYSWRSLATRAADRAIIPPPAPARFRSRTRTRARAAAAQQQQPFDPLSALAPFEGGSLLALCVRDAPAEPGGWLALARALGVSEGTAAAGHGGAPAAAATTAPNKQREKEAAAAADLLRGLRVLSVRGAAPIFDAVAGASLRSPLPAPSLLGGLVELELTGWPSRWADRGGQGGGSGGGTASGKSRRPLCFFTRAHLPSLRALSVSLLASSDCPLELGAPSADADANDDDDPAALPPSLTRLRIWRSPEDAALPPLPASGASPRWPRGEPFLVSQRSLRSLGALGSLCDLWAEQTWASARPHARSAAADGSPQQALPAINVLRLVVQQSRNAPPPNDIAPMGRLLRPLGALGRLTSLRMSSEHDWREAGVSVPGATPSSKGGGWNARTRAYADARLKEWRASVARVFDPMAGTLRRLSIVRRRAPEFEGEGEVSLPSELSLLGRLTCLEVRANRIIHINYDAFSTSLRRLELEAEVPEAKPEPIICSAAFSQLVNLEHLRLSDANFCMSYTVAHCLPSLTSLILWDERVRPAGGDGMVVHRPSVIVLAAARYRLERKAPLFSVSLATGMDDEAPRAADAQLLSERVERRYPDEWTVRDVNFSRPFDHARDHD